MDPWHVYSGLFSILMIEEGDSISNLAKTDNAFKFVFIFASVLSFVRKFKTTMAIMGMYFLIKLSMSPYFTEEPKMGVIDLSLGSKQP